MLHSVYLRLLKIVDRLGKYELTTLVLIGLSAGGVWAFIELADEVIEQETDTVDRTILLAMRNPADTTDPLGPAWLEELMRDFTAFGGIAWITILTLGTLGYLALQRKPQTLWFVLIAVVGGCLVSAGLKAVFSRPRPDLVPHGSHVYSASFPSGHSTMSAATYLTLAGILARVQRQRRMKAYLLMMAILLTVATGVSRVYLGVHWPTDVLAGWTVGASWAAMCWLVAHALQRRGYLRGGAAN